MNLFWSSFLLTRPPLKSTLFPYTTLFRSVLHWVRQGKDQSGPERSGQTSLDRGLREQRSEEHTSELQSQSNLVCRLLLEKKKLSDAGVKPSAIDEVVLVGGSTRIPMVQQI